MIPSFTNYHDLRRCDDILAFTLMHRFVYGSKVNLNQLARRNEAFFRAVLAVHELSGGDGLMVFLRPYIENGIDEEDNLLPDESE